MTRYPIVIDKRGVFDATVVHATPGVYFNLDEHLLLLVGINIAIDTSIKNLSPATIVIPVLPLDWKL